MNIKRTLCGLLAAFLLASCGSTADRHDEHLNDVVVVQYQNKADVSQQYVDAAMPVTYNNRRD